VGEAEAVARVVAVLILYFRELFEAQA